MNPEITALLDWHRRMRDSTDYLGIEQMQPGMTYAIWARNAYVGIWLPEQNGFVISRYKMHPTPFLFVELHWDTGEPFGTAKPLRALEACPLLLPPESDDWNEERSAPLCAWLDDLESRHPPLPDVDTVGARRRAVARATQ